MKILLLIISTLFAHAATAHDVLTDKLSRPWGMAFVAPNQLLISERRGTLQLFDTGQRQLRAVQGAPSVWFDGQGGLLDVAVAADYQPGGWIYFTWSAPVTGNAPLPESQAATALGRARLDLSQQPLQLSHWQTLLVSQSASRSGQHFGSRIAFDEQHVFFSIGDRGTRENGQSLTTHAGKILRLTRDGRIPADNPFAGQPGALAEIWSYGHRNPQGLAYDATHQRLWAIEHGPRGGDEINLIRKGHNYGWPVVSWGKEYWNPMYVGEARSHPDMTDPVKMYDPSIAPGSLLLYQGKAHADWQGNLLAGALKLTHLNRVTLDETPNGPQAITEERLLTRLSERIRALTTDARGRLYLATDSGRLLRYSGRAE
ncbi:MAG: PQQ-dependent sugar dehydrogenase [Saccharospirillaceae bacterium]|nr:PQQ-dependent sugar dehydrogenase [Saccharospirillaceae bacterium]MCD8530585.1 PQQ-dependent sugar dehydrogenase [Saccharospirillaceae bacterium]